MTLKDVRRLLLELDMNMKQLAREFRCTSAAIYLALSTNECPNLKKKLAQWYEENKGRAA